MLFCFKKSMIKGCKQTGHHKQTSFLYKFIGESLSESLKLPIFVCAIPKKVQKIPITETKAVSRSKRGKQE